MASTGYLLLGFAPGLFWLWYFRRKDRLEPEPRSLVLRAFVFGCGAALAVTWLRPWYAQMILWFDGRLARELADYFVVTAGGEEFFKALAVLIPFWAHHEFDEPLDGIVYGVAAALGFASVENVYKMIEIAQADTILFVAFTSTLAHVGFTGCIGYFIGRAKFSAKRSAGAALLFTGFAIGVVLHGVYDLLITRGVEARVYSLLIVLPNVLLLLGLQIRWAADASPHLPPADGEG